MSHPSPETDHRGSSPFLPACELSPFFNSFPYRPRPVAVHFRLFFFCPCPVSSSGRFQPCAGWEAEGAPAGIPPLSRGPSPALWSAPSPSPASSGGPGPRCLFQGGQGGVEREAQIPLSRNSSPHSQPLGWDLSFRHLPLYGEGGPVFCL